MDEPQRVLHWYDFICPYCYVAQDRTAILARRGIEVAELPFRAHPEIPPGGIRAPSRTGPMYAFLGREAEAAGLPLHWPPRLPNTLRALEVAEWVRRYQPPAFPRLHNKLFAAHFALGEDLEDLAVIDRHAAESGVDLAALHAGLADDGAAAAVRESEALGRRYGVRGTPAWLMGGRLVEGLRPAVEFERLADHIPYRP